ncbi:ribosomal RNA small subunit methyltransferase A [bacterium]|nr:ribosomal RNA small subunit methyltransferase A [candidate division CSSED10-310 bacterium]
MIDPLLTLSEDLHKLNWHPNKLRGQNFLLSAGIRKAIIDLAELDGSEHVFEVGPGTGIMTFSLAMQAKAVTAVEADPVLSELLKKRFGTDPSVTIIQGDGLIHLRNFPGTRKIRRCKFVANIPFSLSSPLLTGLADLHPLFCRCVVMLQKEVASRVTARPGDRDRGYLSVLVQSRYTARMELQVPGKHFIPRPAVDSSVVVLEPRHPDDNLPDDRVIRLAGILFTHRRKTVLNNLRMQFRDINSGLLSSAGIDSRSRAQDLDETQLISLARILKGTDT